jgi:hypothetical protein
MSTLADTYRDKATGMDQAADQLYAASDFATNPQKQCLFTVGKLKATIFATWADVLASLEQPVQVDPQTQAPAATTTADKATSESVQQASETLMRTLNDGRDASMKAFLDRLALGQKLRIAAAQGFSKGDYSEFDSLVSDSGFGSAAGDGPAANSGPAAPADGGATGATGTTGGNGGA